MILLLGASGYIGQAFNQVLEQRAIPFRPISRNQIDYTRFEGLYKFLIEQKPSFVINAAGYTGKPNVDACEIARADTLQGNTLLPATVANACAAANVPWGHVSSGCIYTGAKIVEKGKTRVVTDLTQPEVRTFCDTNPEAIQGFNELDEPNFSFRSPPCSFYSGTKALGEEAICFNQQTYVWRLRIPFDEIDNSRNYLSKLQRYPRIYENVNSISHRFDFVSACLDLWAKRAPFGIYNVTNPGFVTTRRVVEAIVRILGSPRPFEFWANDEEFYRFAAKTPRSNCVMDISKLLGTGVNMRPVEDAIDHALRNWKANGSPLKG